MPHLRGARTKTKKKTGNRRTPKPKEPGPGEEGRGKTTKGGRPVQDPADDQTRGENRQRQGTEEDEGPDQ